MKTVTCNNCHRSFQIVNSATLLTCPCCHSPVFLPGEIYVSVETLERIEKKLQEKKNK